MTILGQVKLDLSLNQFDESLLKYKPRTVGHQATEITCPLLFEKFTHAMQREKGLSEGSLTKYRGLLSHLKRFLNKPAFRVTYDDALNFRAALLEKVSERTAREYLWLVHSSFEWAVGRAIPEKNPFKGISRTIKPPHRKRVIPFTEKEIKLILEGFKSDRYYAHYFDAVLFMFTTGARPGEVFGLRWHSVSDDFSEITVCEGAAKGKARKTTKTGRSRVVYLGDVVSEMLRDRHSRLSPNPNDLVFPAPKGGIISDHTFRRRAWASVLERVGLDYKKLYTTRHSAGSHAYERGENPAAIAEQLGHSLEMFLSTYCHSIEKKAVFKEF